MTPSQLVQDLKLSLDSPDVLIVDLALRLEGGI